MKSIVKSIFCGVSALSVMGYAPAFSVTNESVLTAHSHKEESGPTHDTEIAHDHSLHEHAQASSDSHDHSTCSHDHETTTHQNHDENEHIHHEECHADDVHSSCDHAHLDRMDVHITPSVRKSLSMQFEKVELPAFSAERSYQGQMVISPESILSYPVMIAGRVIPLVRVGQKIHKGDPLYELTSPNLAELISNVHQNQAHCLRLQRELVTLTDRKKKLDDIGTRNSELETQITFKQAELNSAQETEKYNQRILSTTINGAELQESSLLVRALSDGVVQTLNVVQGDWAEQGTLIMTLVNPQNLEFLSMAYGGDNLTNKKAKLALTIKGKTSYFDGILRMTPQVDPASSMRTLYFTPQNLPKDVFSGQKGRLDILSSLSQEDEFVMVPNSAVIKNGIDTIVFTQNPENENTFHLHKVETGISRQGRTPVKGVPLGATIVTKGGYELKFALADLDHKKEKPAGHFHADGKFHEGEH